jgi:DNA-binding transcriptional MerR regulator
MVSLLPPIPAKRYFTIGEVGDLCGVKPHVLRYWEQEFTQLRPVKRRGNRRYYQRHEVLMIRRIRGLLYDQGFTISGARNKLLEITQSERQLMRSPDFMEGESVPVLVDQVEWDGHDGTVEEVIEENNLEPSSQITSDHGISVRDELLYIRSLLSL